MARVDQKQVRADASALIRDRDPGRNEQAYMALVYALEDIASGVGSDGATVQDRAQYAAAKLRELADKIPGGGAS